MRSRCPVHASRRCTTARRCSKTDCVVLDFQNSVDAIVEAFQSYYQTTILSEETDPNKLHDLKRDLDDAQVYSQDQVDEFVTLFLGGAAGRGPLDAILDVCVDTYCALDEDQRVDFKGKAKAFCRTYAFLSAVLPFSNWGWEKLSILLNLLVAKLGAPAEDDLAQGILEAIDMDSYRVEKLAAMALALADNDAEIGPVPVSGGGAKPDPKLDRLSNILKQFNEMCGTLFDDSDRVLHVFAMMLPRRLRPISRIRTPRRTRRTHGATCPRSGACEVMQLLLKDDTEVYKQFVENESLRRSVLDLVYDLTSDAA
jgi:type I restriction enzyme, R subunit